MTTKTLGAAAAIFIASVCWNGSANTSSAASPADGGRASMADPHSVLGDETCVKCHASEVQVWSQTPHSRTFEELHRRPEAKTIASKLGLKSIKNEGRCVACHYTQKAEAGANRHVIAGVSCESCHGAAKGWLDIHHNYGGDGISRMTETPEHRVERIAKSVAAGMRNPRNVYSVAQSCLRCHTTADEELVNVGGHTPGSLEFEFVSWSQGMVRHNFVRTGGKSNDASSPERIRVMFVAGMVAELEASLRATAKATQKATYGVTAAKRAARAGARIKSVAQKVDSPTLDKIVSVYESITLKLNNSDQLTTAADQVAAMGFEFANSADGSTLGALDSFVPKSDSYK
ncbi:MAG: cytochrome c family protein [Pirellulaceae bacterium]